jgi:hypothetical protein
MRIHSIYDAGDTVADRYTVYYKGRGTLDAIWNGRTRLRTCRAMSVHPQHPQGFGQWSSGNIGKHNGKKITFEELPEDCQKLVLQDLKG